MFNRAWRGLKSQGWMLAVRQAGEPGSRCAYLTADGRRCAWGWVDPEGTANITEGGVGSLHADGVGLAAQLSRDAVDWACALQNAHDRVDPCYGAFRDLKTSMEAFAEEHNLTIPED